MAGKSNKNVSNLNKKIENRIESFLRII